MQQSFLPLNVAMTVCVFGAAIVGILLVFALLGQKKNTIANRCLATVILLSVMNQFLFLSKAAGYQINLPFLIRLNFPILLLNSSLVYLYFRLMTYPGKKLSLKDGVHLIPFFIGLVWYFSLLIFGSEKWFLDGQPYRMERYGRDIIRACFAAFYLVLSFRLVNEFRKRLLNVTAKQDLLSVNWLRLLFGLIFLIWAAGLTNVFAGPNVDVWKIKPILLLFSLSAVALFALKNSAVFDEIKKVDISEKDGHLSTEQLTKYTDDLIKYLKVEKPYLNADLKLSDLAELVGLKSYQMSEVINRGMGSTFFDLVNRNRVEEAKKRLRDSNLDNLSILGIAMDCGFNSKSTFSLAFKKWAGTTPSDYRSKII